MPVKKKTMHVPRRLCEAYHYSKPVPFSRGMRVDIAGAAFLFISGTASVNEKGESVHHGNLTQQARRTFENITGLLESEGASWKNVVKTTLYLADMRYYEVLSRIRLQFFKSQGLTSFPASTCVEARLCRPELLVEVEAIAIFNSGRRKAKK